MRLLLRKVVTEVGQALQRLDQKTRSLDERVTNLESIEPQAITQTVIEQVTQAPVELPDFSELVYSAIDEYLQANPLRQPEDGRPGKDADEVSEDQIIEAVEKVLESYEFEIPEPEAVIVDYERVVLEVLGRLTLPEPEKVDYDYILSRLPKPEQVDYDYILSQIPTPQDARSITGATIEGFDLYLQFSDGSQTNVGRVVGADGETTVRVETQVIKGNPGDDGKDGVGIEDIYQDEEELVIVLTDETEKRFKLPSSKQVQYVGGGYLSEKRVIELIQQNGGGGGSQQEVFLGAPSPLPNYPALVFDPVTIDGQLTYKMRFNDGVA